MEHEVEEEYEMEYELSARQKYLTFICLKGGEGWLLDYQQQMTLFGLCISNSSAHLFFDVISKRQ